jgi:chromosome segregation ATPase
MDKIKEYLTVKNIAILVLLLLLVGLSIRSSCSRTTPDVNAMITQATQALTEQYETKIAEKDNLAVQYKSKIEDYKNRLYVSEAKYQSAMQTIDKLKRERDNVKPPTSSLERRKRFADAGFPMLPDTK